MKICLIGSTRFMDLYQDVNQKLTLNGHIVYSVAYSTSQHRGDDITEAQKEILDLVHLQKIQESEAVVLITDETGYFGDSTRRELIWASMLGKEILSVGDIGTWRLESEFDLKDFQEDIISKLKRAAGRG